MLCWVRLDVQDLPAVHIRTNRCDVMGSLWLHFGPRSSRRLTLVAVGGQPAARMRPLGFRARASRRTGCYCAPWTVGCGTVAGVPLRCRLSASRPTALLVAVVVGPASIVLAPPPPPCCCRRPPCSRSARPPSALPPPTLAPPLVARRSRRGPPILRPAPPRYTLLGPSAAPPALVPSPLPVGAPALWRRRWLPVALVVGPAAHALAPPCLTLLCPAAASPALVAFPLPVAAPALWRRHRPCASSLRPPSPFPSHLFGATACVGAALAGAFSSVRPPLRLPVRLPVSRRRREDGVVRRARLCPGRV